MKQTSFNHCVGSDAVGGETGIGDYTPILLDEVTCTGSEERLIDCGHTGIGVRQCSAVVGEATAFCSGI